MATSCATRWWDRDVDEKGRPIRSDLRVVAHDVWAWASNVAQSRLGDTGAAADLMDLAVSQASAYLDRRTVPLDSYPISHLTGLLRRCFWSVLQRHAKQLQRLELVGGSSELSDLAADQAWGCRIEARLDFDRMVRHLSEQSRTIITLRDAGYEWKEIAQFLGTTVSAAKKSFFREIRELQLKIAVPPYKSRIT